MTSPSHKRNTSPERSPGGIDSFTSQESDSPFEPASPQFALSAPRQGRKRRHSQRIDSVGIPGVAVLNTTVKKHRTDGTFAMSPGALTRDVHGGGRSQERQFGNSEYVQKCSFESVIGNGADAFKFDVIFKLSLNSEVNLDGFGPNHDRRPGAIPFSPMVGMPSSHPSDRTSYGTILLEHSPPAQDFSSPKLLHRLDTEGDPSSDDVKYSLDSLWYEFIPAAVAANMLDEKLLKLVGDISSTLDVERPRNIYWRVALGRYFLKREWVQFFHAAPSFLDSAPADVQQVYKDGKKTLARPDMIFHGGTQFVQPNPASHIAPPRFVNGNHVGLSPAVRYIYERVNRHVPHRYEGFRDHPFIGMITPTCADVFAPRVILTAEELLSYFPRQSVHFRSIAWRLSNNGWTATNMLEFQFAVRDLPSSLKRMPGFSRSAVQHSIGKANKHFLDDKDKKSNKGPIIDLYLWDKDQARGSHIGAEQLEDMPIIHLPYGLKVRPSGKGRGLLSAAIELCEATGNDRVTLRNYNQHSRQLVDLLWKTIDPGFWSDLQNGVNLDSEALQRHRPMMNGWSFRNGNIIQ